MGLTCSQELLTEAEHARDLITDRLTCLQAELDCVNEQLAVFSKASSETVVQERNIRDNLRCRGLTVQIAELEDRVHKLSAQVRTFDCQSANEQVQCQELKYSELLGERSAIFGELRQLRDHMDSLRHELHTDYGRTESDYRDQFVKFNVAPANPQGQEAN